METHFSPRHVPAKHQEHFRAHSSLTTAFRGAEKKEMRNKGVCERSSEERIDKRRERARESKASKGGGMGQMKAEQWQGGAV